MKNGFIRVGYATPNVKVADVVNNEGEIIKKIDWAYENKLSILTLPELCVTGYTCGDLFFQQKLLAEAEAAVLRIAEHTKEMQLFVFVGAPIRKDGKLYNCAVTIFDGRILGFVPKTFIPNYNEFQEVRYFAEGPKSGEIMFNGEKYPFGSKLLFNSSTVSELSIAAEICEDLWVADPPSNSHAQAGATIICNLSASNETVNKEEYRRELVKNQSARLMCAYVYASAGLGESTTDLVFSAHSLICEDGVIMKESSLFKNESGFVEVDLQKLTMERTRNNCFVQKDSEYKTVYFDFAPDDAQLSYKISQSPFVPSVDDELTHRCEKILTMQAVALKKRLEHIGSDSLVLGISGGLDSCLALLVCARTMDMLNLPRKNVLAVTMPCFGTTERTRKNAFDLCGELGVSFKEISIFDSVIKHFEDIGHDRDDHSVVYENAQARERMQVLMDLANKMNGIVVGTGDLSEMALGWATFNGDHISMYSVNGDIPKTLVRYLVRHEAERSGEGLKNTLYSILDTPVSPELLPAENGKISQKTEEIVGPYELHDFFIYYCLRFGFSPAKIYLLAKNAFDGVYDDETILKWLKSFYKRVFAQQYKRSTMPDGPKIGSVSLSPRGDLRLPSDAVSRLWLDEANSLN